MTVLFLRSAGFSHPPTENKRKLSQAAAGAERQEGRCLSTKLSRNPYFRRPACVAFSTRSGFSATAPLGCQLRVWRDQPVPDGFHGLADTAHRVAPESRRPGCMPRRWRHELDPIMPVLMVVPTHEVRPRPVPHPDRRSSSFGHCGVFQRAKQRFPSMDCRCSPWDARVTSRPVVHLAQQGR